MLTYILFILGFFIIIKSAELLVDGSSSIAKKLKISTIVIGLTVVSFGTSMPELAINLFASFGGSTQIAIGNILGSNIANILLILGISAFIYPLRTKENTTWKEIPFSLLAVIVLTFLISDVKLDGGALSILSRIDGLVLLSFFVIFLYYTFSISKISKNETEEGENEIKVFNNSKSISFVILGCVGLFVGGKWIVDGAILISQSFNLSESLIALTVIAIGTSLPELATSAVAAYKKQTDIAIGNVVGSNVFNILWVLGLSSFIRPIPFDNNSQIDIFVTIFATLLLFMLIFIGRKHVIQRWQGALMIFFYIIYIIFLILYK